MSVQFSRSVGVVSHSLWSHEPQYARPPCPSPTPRVYPNPCPTNQWCHETISSSVVPFSSCPQSFPASGSFQMSQLFASGGQSIEGVLFSNNNEHPGLISFRMDWLDLLAVQVTLKSLLQHHSSKVQFLVLTFLYSPTLTSIHDHWKNYSLARWTFVGKVMSLFFNMLSKLVITFLQRIKCLLISWLQSPSAVILEPRKIKSATVSTVPHLFAMKWWDQLPWS